MMSNQVNRITITQDKQPQDHKHRLAVIMDDIQRQDQLKAPTGIATSEQRCGETANIT